MNEKLKEKLEGELAGTSPAEEPNSVPGLNNEAVPTEKEEENAGLDSGLDSDEVESNPNSEPISDSHSESEDPAPVSDAEPEVEISSEEEIVAEPIQEETCEGELEPELGLAEGSATKTFTQSQVDEIAGKIRKETRERVTKDLLSRYGVLCVEDLDDLFSNAQRFDIAQDEFAEKSKAWEQQDLERNNELASVKERIALLESGIDKARFEDAKFILKGKGLEITPENIASELETHPEWKVQEQAVPASSEFPFKKQPSSATKIIIPDVPVLGNEGEGNRNPELSERERALKMFKV